MPRCRPFRKLVNQVRDFCRPPSSIDHAVESTLAPITRALARQYLMEPLEERRMLHTITGSGVMEYLDGSDDLVRIRWHNLTAELVFARVTGVGSAVLGEPTLSGDNGGKDLYHIYIAESSVDSFMSIARVPDPSPGQPRPMLPFTGQVSIRHTNLNNGESVTTGAGSDTGAILLGAKTPSSFEDPANHLPILNQRFNGLGILGERPNGRLNAGLTVAPGQDFGRFFFGGTILGQVTFQGSIDQFYAGGLFTGNANGQSSGDPEVLDNFYVGGDIRDLYVGGNVGGIRGSNAGTAAADPSYLTGFDMQVKGSVGQIHVEGDFFGGMDVENGINVPHLRLRQREVEQPAIDTSRGSATNFEGTDGPDGIPRLGDNEAQFDNNTFDTAQYLGTFDSRIVGKNGVHLNGQLRSFVNIEDQVDYYSVPLLAGQVIDVRLVAAGIAAGGQSPNDPSRIPRINIGVFDPDGRLIATDYDSNDSSFDYLQGRPFRVVADRPGSYRIAVAHRGDVDFDGQNDLFPQTFPGNLDYQIQVKGVGELAIGALFAEGHINDAILAGVVDEIGEIPLEEELDIDDLVRPAINAQIGDFGAVNSNSTIASFDIYGTVGALNGNLRSMDAISLGVQNGNAFGAGPSIRVPKGSVGLLRARGEGDAATLIVNNSLRLETIDFGPVDDPTDLNDAVDLYQAIGNDIQTVDGNDEVIIELVANKRIGTIRAGQIGPFLTVIAANADRVGGDGIIDLIDVEGALGSLSAGGPQISTGPGGNVRYMRVGGAIFRDRFFGSGQQETQVFEPGESANFIDDSGARVNLEPIPLERNINFQTGEVELINPGVLTARFYPIRGSGGGALIDVTSTRGLEVNVSGGNAEIGKVSVTGQGAGVVTRTTDVFGNEIEDDELILDPNSDEDLSVILNGSGNVDVLTITGGNFNRILNRSNGEIVSVNASSIGTLAGRTLGLARHTTGAHVIPNAIDYGLTNANLGIANGIGNTFPLIDERTGIVVSGDLVLAQATHGIGNLMVGGTMQTVSANADGRFTSGVFEGIDGVVLSFNEIRDINVGEGLSFSGTGNVAHAGIYARGRIVRVTNQGPGSDIRGDIVSRGQSIVINNPNTGRADPRQSGGIVSILLNNGSIIDADIMVVDDFQGSQEFPRARLLPDAGGITTDPVFEIGTVSLEGTGGIIGSQFVSADMSNIVVSNGFGIINSQFQTAGQGTVNNVVADGYGIRDTVFDGGGSVGAMNARGKGNRLSTLGFSSGVRWSETRDFDPYSGRTLGQLNDLHKYLGTTASAPIRTTSRSVSGIIDAVSVVGGRSLGTMTAQRINSSVISFGNTIGSIIARESIDNVEVTSGRIDLLQTAGDIDRANFTIAGPVGVVAVGGTYRGSNEFLATGPDGFINIFATKRSLFGAVRAQKGMNEIRVGTDIGSPSIESSGDINAIRVNGNILTGAFIRSAEDIGNLVVSGDIQEGAIVQADAINNRAIGGTVFGEIIIT